MGNALKFRYTDVPRQNGELARFKVVQGPDYGSVFVIVGPRATIGRGEICDIMVSDLKASRVHAELFNTSSGWVVKDMGSANGISYNGKSTTQATMALNDTLSLGETTLEFVTAEAGTQFLISPARTFGQVQNDQVQQQKVRSQALSAANGGGSSSRLLLIGGVGLALFLWMSGDNSPEPKKKKRESSSIATTEDLSAFLVKPQPNKTADTLFKDGMREYYDKNYNRARTQFETVLQIMPGHDQAVLYLENSNAAIKEEVKLNLSGGKQAYTAGRLRDSKGHFRRVMLLLYKDQTNPAYIEAEEQFKKIVKEISGEEEPPK